MSERRIPPPPRCFQGVVPSMVATCSKDGEPNVTYVSQVYWVDETHVALSRQFFNKTSRNVAENPQACVQLLDPLTFEAWELDLRHERSETSGPLFEEMAMRIEAIASHTGMNGIFKLLAADVYEVLAVRFIDELPRLRHAQPPALPLPPGRAGATTELRALQVVSDRLNRAIDLESSCWRRCSPRSRRGSASTTRCSSCSTSRRQEALHRREPAATARAASAPRSRSARG